MCVSVPPLLERIDLCADVPPVNFSQISEEKPGESSALIRKRVEKARKIQQKRYQNEKICFNGELSGKQIRKYCVLTENALQVAKNAFELMELSARSYHRILKVSRTIADMEGAGSAYEDNNSPRQVCTCICSYPDNSRRDRGSWLLPK